MMRCWLWLTLVVLLSSSVVHPKAEGTEEAEAQRCSFEVEDETVSEVVLEIFADAHVSASANSMGFGPAETIEQHISIIFAAVDLGTIADLSCRLTTNCRVVVDGMPCKNLMSGTTDNAGEMVLYVSKEWRGKQNYALMHLVDGHGTVQAQGRTHFVVETISNHTEGVVSMLAENCQASSTQDLCRPSSRVQGVCTATEDGSACSVSSHHLPALECSQPRMPLRVYSMTNVRWKAGKFHVWIPESAIDTVRDVYGDQTGMFQLIPASEGVPSCASEEIAFLLVGVTGGSVEHLGHFFLDYLFNLYRLMAAVTDTATQRKLEQAVEVDLVSSMWPRALMLLDDMRDSVASLPKRKFYTMLNSLTNRSWQALGELQEETCFQELVFGFGALEVIRASDAPSMVDRVMNQSCTGIVISFQHRILRSFNLEPRVLRPGEGTLYYLSRQDTGWRRMRNENDLVEAWNRDRPSYPMQKLSLHLLPFGEQLELLQDTRVMIGINGGQINALFFLPEGSTCAAIFAMRWTDQNFGYVYHTWLKHRGVRYIQYDVTKGGRENLEWLNLAEYSDEWANSMRPLRDADITMPEDVFIDFVTQAVEPDGSGRFEASDSVAELHHVLSDFEARV